MLIARAMTHIEATICILNWPLQTKNWPSRTSRENYLYPKAVLHVGPFILNISTWIFQISRNIYLSIPGYCRFEQHLPFPQEEIFIFFLRYYFVVSMLIDRGRMFHFAAALLLLEREKRRLQGGTAPQEPDGGYLRRKELLPCGKS